MRPGANPVVARGTFDAAPRPKELLDLEGGHFGLLYHPGAIFDRVSTAQAGSLMRHL
jgi:hypothetical protein